MKQHQHYVPQFYLNNFTKNRSGRLIAYRRDGTPITGHSRDFCGENEFYSFADHNGKLNRCVEEMFSNFETSWARTIGRLLIVQDADELTMAEREDVAFFLAFLRTRDRRFREHMKNLADLTTKVQFRVAVSDEESLKRALSEYEKKLSDEEVKEIRDTILDDGYTVEYPEAYWIQQSLLMALQAFPFILEKDHWQLVRVDYPREALITSDSPVAILRPPDTNPLEGVGVINGILYVPLAPDTCLFLHDSAKVSASLAKLDGEKVRYLNGHQMFNAYRFVFSDIYYSDVSSVFKKTRQGDGHKVVAHGPPDIIPDEYRFDTA